ncbi:ion channel [Natronomonas sp.]|uniref:ion channel n=1 Tax=Natronomonas sp. TaxID=2184060 RepID=UPI00398A1F1C
MTRLAEFGDSIYNSTLTFTALGFGDLQPVGFGRVSTAIETSLGAVLLAFLVFVFILGRRAAR